MSRTKIVCTIGPATRSRKILKQLIEAGMSVARFNFSHGDPSEHLETLKTIRSLSDNKVAVLLDLQGPRIRTGSLERGKAFLKDRHKIILTGKNVSGSAERVSITPAKVIKDIHRGDLIYIADATIRLKVLSVLKDKVKCLIEDGGILGEHKGVNLPATKLSLPSVTDKDKKDILWGVRNKVDYIGISFVRQPKDVLEVKKILKRKRSKISVIAKLEKPEAIKNLEEIVKVSDGIMVARGDLGIEMSLAKVPMVQKKIITTCRLYSKPVITATQMLESMVSEERPTRAEASDVANAVLDGTDAIMLSEETAIGRYPVEAVRVMARIAGEAEKAIKYLPDCEYKFHSIDFAVSHAACQVAKELGAKAILTFTETGSTALRVSKYRPETPIIGIVTRDEVLRKLALYFAVQPIKIKAFKYFDHMIVNAEKALLKLKIAKKGDIVVLTAGIPVHIPGTTNLIRVHRIGQ